MTNNMQHFLKEMQNYDTTAMYIEDFNQMNKAFMINSSIVKLFNDLNVIEKAIANEEFFNKFNKTLQKYNSRIKCGFLSSFYQVLYINIK